MSSRLCLIVLQFPTVGVLIIVSSSVFLKYIEWQLPALFCRWGVFLGYKKIFPCCFSYGHWVSCENQSLYDVWYPRWAKRGRLWLSSEGILKMPNHVNLFCVMGTGTDWGTKTALELWWTVWEGRGEMRIVDIQENILEGVWVHQHFAFLQVTS